MKNKLLFLLFFLLNSCQMYKSNFDCPPNEGVPCTPVSEIQKMIIETPEGGPDIFLGKIPSKTCSDCTKKRCRTHHGRVGSNSEMKRIWVEGMDSDCSIVQGHYIYFQETCQAEECP